MHRHICCDPDRSGLCSSSTVNPPTDSPWFDAGSEQDIAPGSTKLIRTGQQHVLVVHTEDGEYRAIDNRCPHVGYPLNQGHVRGCVVTCPWHNFKFDLRDGSCLKGDEAVRTYPVRRQAGRVYLDLREGDPGKAITASMARVKRGPARATARTNSP